MTPGRAYKAAAPALQTFHSIQIPELLFLKMLRQIRQLCDERDIALIYDEVQTGLGRTGKLFAYQHAGVAPDIMTLAKALGGGAPIGAFLTTDKVAAAFQPGDHGSTFGGNPLVCAAGLAVLKIMLEQDIPFRAAMLGEYLCEKLAGLQAKYPCIKEIRGQGLLLGVQLDRPGADVVQACLRRGGVAADSASER